MKRRVDSRTRSTLGFMLPDMSSSKATVSGCRPLENVAISTGFPLSRSSKSSFVRSGTDRPSASRTVA